jgi:translation initiation factor 2 subunit 2
MATNLISARKRCAAYSIFPDHPVACRLCVIQLFDRALLCDLSVLPLPASQKKKKPKEGAEDGGEGYAPNYEEKTGDDDDESLDFSKKKVTRPRDSPPHSETARFPKPARVKPSFTSPTHACALARSQKKKEKKAAPPAEDDDEDDDEVLDFSSKKKKAPAADDACSGDDDDDDDDDAVDVGDDDDDGAGGFVSIPADREYKYEELLDRMYSLLHANNPELAGDRKRFLVKPPQVVREGSKRVVLVNFGEICKTLNRSVEHVQAFMLAEMGTTGSIDASNRMVIKGRFPPKAIEQIIRRYVGEYVSCSSCKSPSTTLQKQNRLYFMQCNNCGARRSVTPIKTGFVAISRGARKKNRA